MASASTRSCGGCRIAIRSCSSTACSNACRASASSRVKNVTVNEPFFAGHFPGRPVMPGVMILEALAQAAGILCFVTAGIYPDENAKFYFVGIDKARFRRPVVPGDQLRAQGDARAPHPDDLEIRDGGRGRRRGSLLGGDDGDARLMAAASSQGETIDEQHRSTRRRSSRRMRCSADDVEVGAYSRHRRRASRSAPARGSARTSSSRARRGSAPTTASSSSRRSATRRRTRSTSGEPTRLEIGDRNVIREFVTLEPRHDEGRAA